MEAPQLEVQVIEDDEVVRTMRYSPILPVKVGSEPGMDLQLAADDIGGLHAVMTPPSKRGHWKVLNIDVSIGTLINGEPIEEPRAIRNGDEIRLGAATLRVRFVEPAATQDSLHPDEDNERSALVINDAASFETIADLEQFDGNLMISVNLERVRLGKLREVNGTLLVLCSESTRAVELPELQAVRGNLRIHGLSKLQTVSAPKLKTVGGTFQVTELGLTTLTLEKLRSVEKLFCVLECHNLPNLVLPELAEAGRTFVAGCGQLGSISAPELTNAGSGLTLVGLPALQTVELPRLQRVDGSISLDENKSLKGLQLPALESAGDLTLHPDCSINMSDLDAIAARFQSETSGRNYARFRKLTKLSVLAKGRTRRRKEREPLRWKRLQTAFEEAPHGRQLALPIPEGADSTQMPKQLHFDGAGAYLALRYDTRLVFVRTADGRAFELSASPGTRTRWRKVASASRPDTFYCVDDWGVMIRVNPATGLVEEHRFESNDDAFGDIVSSPTGEVFGLDRNQQVHQVFWFDGQEAPVIEKVSDFRKVPRVVGYGARLWSGPYVSLRDRDLIHFDRDHQIWNAKTGERLDLSIVDELVGDFAKLRLSYQIAPSGERLLVFASKRDVDFRFLFELPSMKLLSQLAGRLVPPLPAEPRQLYDQSGQFPAWIDSHGTVKVGRKDRLDSTSRVPTPQLNRDSRLAVDGARGQLAATVGQRLVLIPVDELRQCEGAWQWPVVAAAIQPECGRVVVQHAQAATRVFQPDDGRELILPTEGSTGRVAISPDGRRIARQRDDSKVEIFELPAELSADAESLPDPLVIELETLSSSMAFRPDSQALAVGLADPPSVAFFDLSGERLGAFHVVEEPYPIGFNAGGGELAALQHQWRLTQWSVPDGGVPTQRFSSTIKGARTIAIDFDGTLPIVGMWVGEESTRLVHRGGWVETHSAGEPVLCTLGRIKIAAACFSPGGNFLVASRTDGQLVVWRFDDEVATPIHLSPAPAASHVSMSSDGRVMLVTDSNPARLLAVQIADAVDPADPADPDATCPSPLPAPSGWWNEAPVRPSHPAIDSGFSRHHYMRFMAELTARETDLTPAERGLLAGDLFPAVALGLEGIQKMKLILPMLSELGPMAPLFELMIADEKDRPNQIKALVADFDHEVELLRAAERGFAAERGLFDRALGEEWALRLAALLLDALTAANSMEELLVEIR